MNRRELLGGASAAWLGMGLDGVRGLAEPAKADELRVGMIGPGSRGQELIRQLLHVAGVRITAICDIYEPRYAQVNRLVGTDVPHTKDYRELLERKDLDVIYVATPVSLHAEHVLAALETGRPVYGEKAMGFTPEECKEIYAAAMKPGALFQIGHQYRYAPWVRAAVEDVKKGKIGEPTHVYAYWHRNNNWRRPVPSPDPGGRLEHLINWRLYRETSGGLVTELGSHHIDIANWVFDAIPERATGMTSIVRYHDGRTVGDNVQAVFSYPGGRRLMFSSITDNAKMGNDLWIYGTEGSVAITIEDATFYYEPKTHPKPVVSGSEVVTHGITTGASYSTKGEMPYRGPGERLAVTAIEDPTLTACRAFIECVRAKRQPLANARAGYGSAIAASIANRAVYEAEGIAIPALPV
ncbi:MAG TPA: Gfo/Idh/MocA family oxidoreductase [Acidobacteriaceae bacterium]